MIVMEGINKIYKGDSYRIQALSEIRLHIEEGEMLAIMGRSGSGKSTLLNLMGFLDVPDSGSFHFLGRDVSRLSSRQLWRYRRDYIGFVFQHFALINHCSVFENIALPLEAMGIRKRERIQRVNRVVDMLEIPDLLKKYPGQISGGQRQRVAIARAIVCDPKVLLADEPTGALDAKTGDELMGIFKKLNQEGKTIIIVTHDKEIAGQTKRILTLEESRLVADDEKEEEQTEGSESGSVQPD